MSAKQIRDRFRQKILNEERAAHRAEIVFVLRRQLEKALRRGFAAQNLRCMVQFAEVLPDQEIVVSLTRQLMWTHFVCNKRGAK